MSLTSWRASRTHHPGTPPTPRATAANLPSEAPAPAEEGPVWHTTRQRDTVDGIAAIRNGQLTITNPIGDGLPAVLIPGDDVVVTIEGETVTEPVSVWAGNNVQVRPRTQHCPVRGCTVRVSEDRMAAWLRLESIGPPGFRVADAGPGHVIRLTAQPLPGEQTTPAPDEVEQMLHTAGVRVGIDRAAIVRALGTAGSIEVEVARGTPPRPGRPGRVHAAVPDPFNADPSALATRVQAGDVIAQVSPALHGEPGFDVTGRLIQPEPVTEVCLVAGPGVRLDHGCTVASAERPGRPSLMQVTPDTWQAGVVPVTEVTAPLSPRPTPYRFDGDVIIAGDLAEGVTVQASGWIWVKGSARGCELHAGQGIRIDGHAHRSRLKTTSRSALTALGEHYGRILRELVRLRAGAEQILNHPRYAEVSRASSVGQVIRLLADNQFRHLRQWIGECRRIMADLAVLQLPIDLEAVINTVEHLLYTGGLNSIADLELLMEALRAAEAWLADSPGAAGISSPIRVDALLGSEVEVAGEIQCVSAEQCKVHAKGWVQIANLRDTRVWSAESVEVGTALATRPNAISLAVSPGGRIHVEHAVQGVALEIGSWRRLIWERCDRVHADSTADGHVRFSIGHHRRVVESSERHKTSTPAS